MQHVGDGRCILHHPHEFRVPSHLLVVIVLISFFVTTLRILTADFMQVPAISGLYVTIVHLLANPKAFRLPDQMSWQMAALFAILF